MNWYGITNLINGIFSLFIGIFVISRNAKNKIYIYYGLFCFSVAAWCIPYSIWSAQVEFASALFWLKALMFSVFFIHSLYLHSALLILNKIKKLRHVLIFSYLISFVFAILNFTPFLFTSFEAEKFFKFWPNANFLMSFFIFTEIIICYYTGYLYYKEYKTSEEYSRKNQMKYLFILTFIGFSGGFTNWFYWYNIPIPPFGNLIVTLYLSLMTYAIIKHHLLDINLVIRKGLIYSILVTTITLIYLLLIFISETVFRGFIGYKSIPWTLSVILVFALLFQPLRNKIQYFVDKIFFKKTSQEIEQENIQLREELQRSEKLKAVGTLAAGMAHEIKNPLTSIKTFTEYLPKKYQDKEFIDKFERIVGSEVNKIDNIVGQLLDFAKPRPLEIKKSNIRKLIDETLEFLNNDFIKYHINVIKNYTISPTLKVDLVQIKQVFLNIILNAIESMKEKGGKLIVTIKQSELNFTEISIEDTGCGVNKKDLEHLFDPFFTTKETSTGLGLSIVHGIIEKHKGKIRVDSQLGKRTKFTLLLPNT